MFASRNSKFSSSGGVGVADGWGKGGGIGMLRRKGDDSSLILIGGLSWWGGIFLKNVEENDENAEDAGVEDVGVGVVEVGVVEVGDDEDEEEDEDEFLILK